VYCSVITVGMAVSDTNKAGIEISCLLVLTERERERERDRGKIVDSNVLHCPMSRPWNRRKFCYSSLKRAKNSIRSRAVHYTLAVAEGRLQACYCVLVLSFVAVVEGRLQACYCILVLSFDELICNVHQLMVQFYYRCL